MNKKLNLQMVCAYYGDTAVICNGQIYAIKEMTWAIEHKNLLKEAKLFLYRLLSITDEDTFAIARMLLGPCSLSQKYEVFRFEKSIDIIKRDGNNVKTITITENSINAENNTRILRAYDYLRSNGYDLGYGDIKSLIDYNLAIELISR